MCKPQLIALGLVCFAAPGMASELVITVSGIRSNLGEVGSALHTNASEFPTGNTDAIAHWRDADPAGVTCRFPNLRAGAYAVAVSRDLNGNRETDTNFLGMPTEDWGVPNNPRHRLRARRS